MARIDAMRESSMLPRESDAKFAELRRALIDGERSAPSAPFDFDAFNVFKRTADNIGS
ncbi:MAG: type II toxin-antitoxin system ParD family antitoxin [Caulobacteraceae bacterium]|nr:type II toxin-antitoxin system ParD family antitoxin [Caulobacteraceae bacterium]